MSDDFEDLVNKKREVARRVESKRQAEQQAASRAEQERHQAEEETHMALAKKFISALRSREIAPLSVYTSGDFETHRVYTGRKFIFFKNWMSTRRRALLQIGEGWIIQAYVEGSSWSNYPARRGLVLMTDGQVHTFGCLIVDCFSWNTANRVPEAGVYVDKANPTGYRDTDSPLSNHDNHEPLRCLAMEGSDQLLADAVVAHEQGKLKRQPRMNIP